MLVKLGADLKAVHQQVLGMLSGDQGKQSAAEGVEPGRRETSRLREEVARLRALLAQHGIDADATENDAG